jgi:RNA polymerase sigma factor (sigma-70 family)
MEVIRNFADTEIVSNLKTGQSMEEAIKCLYRDHFNTLSWYVMNNNGSRQDAEDIFQEIMVTFIDMVQKNKFRGESTIKTFLYSLNRHSWLNELKRRGRAMVREEKFEKGRVHQEPDTADLIADREDKLEIARLVNSLGESCRRILHLFYYQNLSMREITGQMHYENEQVVRNKKYKCLKQLEQILNKNPQLMETLKNLLHE